MEFVHKNFNLDDTIVSLATPPGMGALAVIRLSGNATFAILEKCFSKKLTEAPGHTVHFGKLLNSDGALIDEVLVSIFRAPRSYTGEDLAEISSHGGHFIPRKIIELFLHYGARPAEPGEFTQRAFLSGKLSLSQAEAVQSLIASQSESAMQFSLAQLSGSLHRTVTQWQQELIRITAICEAWVDFPEEDLAFTPFETLIQDVQKIEREICSLASTYTRSKTLRCGCHVCLVGAPNVGKSSLLNALVKKDRAIVSPIAGTTRDIVEDQLHVDGILFHLADTAGLHATIDLIEQEGIKRSQQAMEKADLILFILDASRPILPEENHYLESIDKEKTLLVWNKCDLITQHAPPASTATTLLQQATVSAQKELGIENLKQLMKEKTYCDSKLKSELVISDQRHAVALQNTTLYLQQVIQGLRANLSPEYICIDLRSSLLELGSLIGHNVTEDVLDSIFSQFCLGK